MDNDPEQQYIEGLTRIKGIEASLSSLQTNLKATKSSTKQISDRIGALEIQGLQEQIMSLEWEAR